MIFDFSTIIEKKPIIMGVLNVTPDSFSDGGSFYNSSNTKLTVAYDHAQRMITDGAKIIDVGGESTRPGADPVSTQEELDRVIPIIEKLSKDSNCIISLDSSSPEVMLAAADAGAGLLNDVRSFRREGALEVVLKTGLPIVLMHMQGEPQDMQKKPTYNNVVEEVHSFLLNRVNECESKGVDINKIIIDPGFGFGKTLNNNFELMNNLESLRVKDTPLLVGTSRKSMIGSVLNKDPNERLYGGLALTTLAAHKGANIIRTHDVGPTMDVIDMVYALHST
jgi:dihydropteroate synthase